MDLIITDYVILSSKRPADVELDSRNNLTTPTTALPYLIISLLSRDPILIHSFT